MIWTQKKLDRFIYLKKIGIPLDEIAKELGCSSSAAQTKSAELVKKGLVPKAPHGGKRTKKEDNKMDTNEKIETAKVTEDFAYTDYTAEAKTETKSEVAQAKQEVEEAGGFIEEKKKSLKAVEPESIDIADEPIKAKPNAYATFNNADAPTDNDNATTDNDNAPIATPTDHTAESRNKVSRADILDCAKLVVNGAREKQYGKPEDNFAIIAKLWSAYKGDSFTPVDVAMMMALLKIARIKTGVGTVDSFVDLAGYAACAGEIAGKNDD